jgi:hypothetical protein
MTSVTTIMFFNVLFAIDLIVAAVAMYYFANGMNRGYIAAFNLYLWLEILACVAAVPVGGLILRAYGHPRLAKGVLMLLAVPAVGYVLFFLMLIVTHPRMN